MTKDQIRAINAQRMSQWEVALTTNHATPVMTLGVGHDHVSGALHIITVEQLPRETIIAFLEMALRVMTAPKA